MPACITAQGNAMPSYAAGKWCANVYHSVASGASYEGVYYLSIHENGLVEINDVIVSIDAPLQIAGYCTYLGTTELGMVYRFTYRKNSVHRLIVLHPALKFRKNIPHHRQ